MPTNNGTLVISAIRPNDSADSYPTIFANEGKGGFHSYGNFNSLSSLPILRRQAGMIVHILDDVEPSYNGLYILENDLITWKLLPYTSGGGVICGQLDNISGLYKVVVLLSSPFTCKISKLILATSIGTCTVTCSIKEQAVPEFINILAVNSVATYTSISLENYVNIEDDITLVINNTSPDFGYINFQIELERVPPILRFPTVSVCGLQDMYQNNYVNI